MIKINLLPQKRAKQRQRIGGAASPTGDSGTKHLLVGIFSVVGFGVLLLVLVDMPLRSDLGEARAENERLRREIARKEQDEKLDLKSYDAMVKAEQAAVAKIQSIHRLLDNRIVPANILHELGQILTTRGPTMTERMAKLVERDPNKKFQTDWEPTHVWLTSFKDTAGVFQLEGGAQSKEDVTQLTKRLAASVYFLDVTPAGGERVADRESGLNYYKFTITGKVAY